MITEKMNDYLKKYFVIGGMLRAINWTNEFTSEVDFVFNYKSYIIPVEAKARINVKAQSLKNFIKEYNTKFALRYSLLNIDLNDKIINIPLYTIWNTFKYLESIN